MYSEKKSVLQLVSLLVAHKIRRAIVCAGSRSSPLAQTLAACPNIETYPCVDERSGAFEAIGLMQATGEPVAICVTSGSALMDASPAVAEACYQELPLVVLSADRPAAWIDQRDGQTMRQAGALQNMVRCSVDLPGQDGPEEEWHRNRLINMALAAARGPVPGPVHINVPLTEPLFAFTARELPKERVLEVMRSSAFHLPEQQYRDVQTFGFSHADGTSYVYYTQPYTMLYNPDLKWQRSRNSELGLDMDLGKGFSVSLVGY